LGSSVGNREKERLQAKFEEEAGHKEDSFGQIQACVNLSSCSKLFCVPLASYSLFGSKSRCSTQEERGPTEGVLCTERRDDEALGQPSIACHLDVQKKLHTPQS
jgi:hypothetical protein